MIAWKFTRPGAVGPFSRVAWPAPAGAAPGAWVGEPTGGARVCLAGVHACDLTHLPYWIGEELWEVELAGPVAERGPKLVAPAGRLVARVPGWDAAAASAFAADAAERIRGMDTAGFVADAEVFCSPEAAERDPFRTAAVSTVIAVEAAERAGGRDAVIAERARQSAWLAAHLGLR